MLLQSAVWQWASVENTVIYLFLFCLHFAYIIDSLIAKFPWEKLHIKRRCYIQQFFLATCPTCHLAKQGGCYTLGSVSCNLSRFRLPDEVKGTFSLADATNRTVATQVPGQMLHYVNVTWSVAESKTQFYFPQLFLQLVSQRFLPLQGAVHWAMFRTTCLAMTLP